MSQDSDPTHQTLLAAVRAEVVAGGTSRTTVTSVAKRAGVSRMTVYRRTTGLEQLFRDALAQEFADAAQLSATNGTVREQIVAQARQIVHRLRASELLRTLFRDEPALIAAYQRDQFGRGQALFADLLQDAIAEGQRDGSVCAGDPALLARVLLMAVSPFVLAEPTVLGPPRESAPDDDALDRELARLVDGYLRPDAS
ncbi:TetR family transcriptional regulator [Calidifontibacter sp. DB0510]|uniref:TetR family transcriptional regulator n=1 Tax=Metallococcus carri TaxID=1656884 RepID=A0A967B0G4_9MICO|nr:TetR family transcriptional regulator [Metallococcus carri]NHN55145.1 TetR family transcriptional regulator [Metallococcus carri]NOP36222.1 TetR family transcriptional regulator [Calidifontibacter sp. DB2511S]